MKNIIIGSGVIGRATGEMLEAYGHDVVYNDINTDTVKKLKEDGKNVELNIKHDYDLYWICTAEWNVEEVINTIKECSPKIVIRSTIKPHEVEMYEGKYGVSIAHIPEFLRQKTAIDDIFDSDRIIIGTNDTEMVILLHSIFKGHLNEKIYTCTPEESAIAKLIANAWLAMQISFWNEMKRLCDTIDYVSPQLVANMVTADRRISKYGSNMIGKPFSGFCFPKDTKSLAKVFQNNGISENMISALIKTNEEMK